MRLVKDMASVLQKSTQAKTRVEKVGSQKWNSVPQWDSNPRCLSCKHFIAKSFVTTEANLRITLKPRYSRVFWLVFLSTESSTEVNFIEVLVYSSPLTISLKKPFFTLTYFCEIRMPFPESALKTLSDFQSTTKSIFLTYPMYYSN